MEKALYSLNSKLEKLSKEESECTIYRVHRHLRNVNRRAYEPEVISIGPYHRGKCHLKMMENHKLRNLQSLLDQRRSLKVDEYAEAVLGEASKARKCYADQNFKLTDDEFIEMLVLDGCFIVELVRKFWEDDEDDPKEDDEDDPIFQMPWMITSLKRDLMLFENQIPFFVLRILFDHIKGPNETRTLPQLLTKFFSNLYPGNEGHPEELLQVDDYYKIKHLLDLIHRNWLQQLNSKKKDEKRQKPNPLQQLNSKKKDEECFRWMCCKTDVESGNKENSLFINHATELTEANVEFKKKEKAETLFDVHFRDGAMVMPPLSIVDGTECFLRNLIVYEQFFGHQLTHTVVTDYMMLLDNLIDSAKDVELLSQKGIITHWQGDDEVVANMVNKLGDLVTCGGSNFSYATVFREVNEHCKKPWNKWLAKLRRDYLNSPWAIISIIAAVVLLLLTVTQTLLSVLQVVQEN